MSGHGLFAAALALALGVGALPAGAAPAPAPARARIVATFFPIYCLAANVAGESAAVDSLLSGNVGPHDYQFSPRDVRKLANADVIVANGLEVDSWILKAAPGSDQQPGGRRIIEIASLLPPALLISRDGGGSRTYNPHVWLDPQLMAVMATNLAAQLGKFLPAQAASFRTNGARFAVRLSAMDGEIAATLAPFRGRPVVTFHDAFPYFARRYGLKIAAQLEEVPESGPSPRDLEALIHTIRSAGVRVIFTEPQFPDKLARQLSRDLGVRLAELDPLETGAPRPAAYEEAMRRNAESVKRVLALP